MLDFINRDILDVEADAWIVPSDWRLQLGNPVANKVVEAAGPNSLREIGKYCFCYPGHAVVTPGFLAKAHVIVFATPPKWMGGLRGESDVLESAYSEALGLAVSCGAKSISVVLLGIEDTSMPIFLSFNALNNSLDAKAEYDSLDVTVALPSRESVIASVRSFAPADRLVKNHFKFGPESKPIIESWNKQKADNWGILLSSYYDRAKQSDFLNPSYKPYEILGLSRETWSRWINGHLEHTDERDKIIAAAALFRLSVYELEDLLSRAGFCLSDGNERDLLIRFCFEIKENNITEINKILHFGNCAPLIDEVY